MNVLELLNKYAEIKNDIIRNRPEMVLKYTINKKLKTNESVYFDLKTSQLCSDNLRKNYIEYKEDYNFYNYKLYMYASYSKEYDCIILSCWDINIPEYKIKENYNDICKNHAISYKEPYLSFLYLITRDKKIIGHKLSYDDILYRYETISTPIIGTIDDFNYELYIISNMLRKTCQNYHNAFSEMFKIGLIKGNKYTTFKTPKEVVDFLNHKEPIKQEKPKQKIIDELVEIELKKPTIKTRPDSLVCVISKVNTEYSVLRWFFNDSKDIYEISRLYVNKTTHIFCRKNTSGEYVVLYNKLKPTSFDTNEVIIQDKDAFKGTKLEYFESIYKELNPTERASALYMLTTTPEFEKIYKSGYSDVCLNYLKNANIKWNAYINNIYGTINKKEKSLTKMLGFNKYQLEKISKNIIKKEDFFGRTYIKGIGYNIKEIFNLEDCSDIDNKTFDILFDFWKEIYSSTKTYDDYSNGFYVKILAALINTYSIKVCINMLPKLKKLFLEADQVYFDSYHPVYVLREILDYINTVKLLNMSSEMRPNFDTIEDIIRMHDDALEAYNMQKSEIDNKKFEERSAFWEKWKYDENEKYLVIAPTNPADLASEGITLHHCVKTYIQKVVNGETNIMFIREKDKQKTPFFTVEISNKGTIEQIHGFGNRNIDTEPGLDKFVKEWCLKKKLRTNHYNKVR